MKAYRSIVTFLTDREPNLDTVAEEIGKTLEHLGCRWSIESREVADEFEDWQAEEIYEANGWLPDTAGDWADIQHDQRGDRP
jgi:hypothetical protein